jgi:hypothetical protein
MALSVLTGGGKVTASSRKGTPLFPQGIGRKSPPLFKIVVNSMTA